MDHQYWPPHDQIADSPSQAPNGHSLGPQYAQMLNHSSSSSSAWNVNHRDAVHQMASTSLQGASHGGYPQMPPRSLDPRMLDHADGRGLNGAAPEGTISRASAAACSDTQTSNVNDYKIASEPFQNSSITPQCQPSRGTRRDDFLERMQLVSELTSIGKLPAKPAKCAFRHCDLPTVEDPIAMNEMMEYCSHLHRVGAMAQFGLPLCEECGLLPRRFDRVYCSIRCHTWAMLGIRLRSPDPKNAHAVS